jgi:Cft2 family RNA processing exonuclease
MAGGCSWTAAFFRDFASSELNWKPFPVEPRSIDAVILTHAHLDHSGYLPRLVKEGFSGQIFATAATRDVARLILLDSARLQEKDAEFANQSRRKSSEGGGPRDPFST